MKHDDLTCTCEPDAFVANQFWHFDDCPRRPLDQRALREARRSRPYLPPRGTGYRPRPSTTRGPDAPPPQPPRGPGAVGIRVCGTPPEPGGTVYRPDGTPLVVMPDGTLRAYPEPPRPEPRPSLLDRVLLLVTCPACLTFRIHPTHVLLCDDRLRNR